MNVKTLKQLLEHFPDSMEVLIDTGFKTKLAPFSVVDGGNNVAYINAREAKNDEPLKQ